MIFDKNRILACEASSNFGKKSGEIDTSVINEDGIEIVKTVISTKEAGKKIGREVGTYLTVCQGELYLGGEFLRDKLSRALARSIIELLKGFEKMPTRLLFVGLGNRELSSDKIGVCVAEALSPISSSGKGSSLSVISTGVKALRGIEACDHVKGLIKTVGFDAVIVADALMTTHPERLFTTVQLSDTGITPASGVSDKGGKAMREISRKTLGVPVISVGVPTVIPFGERLYTPHTIELEIEPISKIIADGITLALTNEA